MLNSSTHKTQPSVTTPCQDGSGSNGNDGLLYIPQISKAGVSPSDFLMSYPGNSLEESFIFADLHSVYSTASECSLTSDPG